MPTILKIGACVCFVLATVKLLNWVNLAAADDPNRDLLRHQALYTSTFFAAGIWFWLRGSRKAKGKGANAVVPESEVRSES